VQLNVLPSAKKSDAITELKTKLANGVISYTTLVSKGGQFGY